MPESRMCLFCRIASRTEVSYVVWEDPDHLAFLSIFPNTPGVTVVIPKAHAPGDAFALPAEDLSRLVLAVQRVARILENSFQARICMIFEGLGVDHVHAKLFPMHGTGGGRGRKPSPPPAQAWTDTYQGFVSSHDGPRAADADLGAVQQRILTHNPGHSAGRERQ